MNSKKKKLASPKRGPRDSVMDAFENPIRPGDKVIWMNPVTNSLELTTVESIVNKSVVRCYILVDKLGNPVFGELAKYGKKVYTRGVTTWKVCGAKSFPKRNPQTAPL